MNAWVVHRNSDIFGHSVDTFRPERWLEADAEQLSRMDANSMQFGLGSRTCTGKNISLLEINKLVPVLVRNFDLEISSKVLDATNTWFVKPYRFRACVSSRRKIKS